LPSYAYGVETGAIVELDRLSEHGGDMVRESRIIVDRTPTDNMTLVRWRTDPETSKGEVAAWAVCLMRTVSRQFCVGGYDSEPTGSSLASFLIMANTQTSASVFKRFDRAGAAASATTRVRQTTLIPRPQFG
jgi:hypothetical protein